MFKLAYLTPLTKQDGDNVVVSGILVNSETVVVY